MGKYFGTDGMRGLAGTELSALHAYKIGRILGNEANGGKVVIGKDTRLSCDMLESALASGICSAGADACLLGITTTACVSYATIDGGFKFGIMISASHNPFYDNGIKVLDSLGEKIDDALINKIEAFIDTKEDTLPFKEGDKIGKICDFKALCTKYQDHLASCVQTPLTGLKIGIDASNGSAYKIAREVFCSLGASVSLIGGEPNGVNINVDCGSTHPEALCALVKKEGLDVGFAYDGDADRCIAVDENGKVVDGDKIMYILARELKSRGELNCDLVVATVMSNLGFCRALEKQGISVIKTKVGDRYVYEEMKNGGYSLGGEQSGHIIISKYASTGDGILTSLKLAEIVKKRGQSLAGLSSGLVLFPQMNLSVRVKNKEKAISSARLQNEIAKAENQLDGGRVLVRASGTEPVIRILVEGEEENKCIKIAKGLRDTICEVDNG